MTKDNIGKAVRWPGRFSGRKTTDPSGGGDGMKAIWKYPLEPGAVVQMPAGAEVLCVQEQDGYACLWVLVDPRAPAESRTFAIYGTGHSLPDRPGDYVGTFQSAGGALVFHVFEVMG